MFFHELCFGEALESFPEDYYTSLLENEAEEDILAPIAEMEPPSSQPTQDNPLFKMMKELTREYIIIDDTESESTLSNVTNPFGDDISWPDSTDMKELGKREMKARRNLKKERSWKKKLDKVTEEDLKGIKRISDHKRIMMGGKKIVLYYAHISKEGKVGTFRKWIKASTISAEKYYEAAECKRKYRESLKVKGIRI